MVCDCKQRRNPGLACSRMVRGSYFKRASNHTPPKAAMNPVGNPRMAASQKGAPASLCHPMTAHAITTMKTSGAITSSKGRLRFSAGLTGSSMMCYCRTLRLTYRRRGGRLSAKNILESGQRCERKPRAAVRWSRLDRRFRFIWFWVIGYSSFAVEPSGVRSA